MKTIIFLTILVSTNAIYAQTILPKYNREYASGITIDSVLYICYNKMVWHREARLDCANVGGRLFRPKSLTNERMVAIYCDFAEFWLGIRRGTHPELFTNEQMPCDDDDEWSVDAYTNWATSEPNNLHGHENCISVRFDGYKTKWNDVSCKETSYSRRMKFVCEI